MAYTSEEHAQVKQAIIDLAVGKRATMVTKDGRTVQYARADMPRLQALERSMASSLQQPAGASASSRTRMVVTSKGL